MSCLEKWGFRGWWERLLRYQTFPRGPNFPNFVQCSWTWTLFLSSPIIHSTPFKSNYPLQCSRHHSLNQIPLTLQYYDISEYLQTLALGPSPSFRAVCLVSQNLSAFCEHTDTHISQGNDYKQRMELPIIEGLYPFGLCLGLYISPLHLNCLSSYCLIP